MADSCEAPSIPQLPRCPADTIRSRSFPVVNWLILLTNVGVFLYFEVGLSNRGLARLIANYGLVPLTLSTGSPHALLNIFTSMFLHAGWLHLISNISSFSEFETYGNFVLAHYPESVWLEYSANCMLRRRRVGELPGLADALRGRYRSLSLHSHFI